MNIASVDGVGKDEPDIVEVACATPLTEITAHSSAEAQWKSGKQEWLIVICLGVVSLMVALDATIVIPALSDIASSTKANAVQSFWFGSAYLLPYAVFQSLIASLSDIFGRRELLLVSVIFFFVGSTVAALAHSVIQMLFGRVIQGIGGGGIVCLTSIIVTDIIPLQQRAAFLAIPQLAWAIGTISGPLLGGLLASHWQWCFWINLPFAGLGLLMIPLVVRLKHRDRLTIRSKLASVDYIGIVLFTSGITVFLVGLSWGGNEFSWNSYQTLLPLMLGATITALSLFYEARFARSPFIKLSIYNNYSSVFALVAAFLQGLIMYSGLYAWNIYFQGVLGKTPIGTGVALLPTMLCTVPSSIVTGQLLRNGVDFRKLILPGWTLLLVGNGLSIIWFVNTPTVVWAITQLVAGCGQGTILIAGVIAIQSHVDAKDVGDAAAMYSFLRGLGLAVGVSLAGTILQNRLHYWLIVEQLPPHIAEDIIGYIMILNTLPESEYTAAVRLAIARSHRNLCEASLGYTALGLLLMLKLRKGDMNKALASKQRIEKKEETDEVILTDITDSKA